jgi:hypothetical protein
MLSLARVAAATGTVLLTTLDDAVWLVPFVGGNAQTTAVFHGVVFCATLTAMAVIVSLVTVLCRDRLVEGWSERAWTAVGAGLAWVLALFLLYRQLRKQRRRRAQVEAAAQAQAAGDFGSSETDPLLRTPPLIPEATSRRRRADGGPQAWMVVSLTFLGSLDEISYFPPLILGGVFTPGEVCLGTLLAALCMLVIVGVFLRPCTPLMDALDRIPLYAIVMGFASLLTLELLWEIVHADEGAHL